MITTNKNKTLDFNFSSIYDPIHGAIDIRDASDKQSNQIADLLKSPMMERLRRVKQLGYASQSFSGADHSRFAHALGTLHIMRKIFHRLDNESDIFDRIIGDIQNIFPNIFQSPDIKENKDQLLQHLLVAALLQDVGELPYGKAVSFVFKPHRNLKSYVEQESEIDVSGWNDKDLFTIACIYAEYHKNTTLFEGLELTFLVFLITGYTKSNISKNSGLLQLRNMLDGVVDADRLDYVYRDAHHTIGKLGNPSTIIESLLFYDDIGPIFSTPTSISDFLILRANLWTFVYFSPQNRFRLLLMTILLNEIKKDENCKIEFFENSVEGNLSLDDFLLFDDISLTARIRKFSDGRKKNNLSQKARYALEILTGEETDYECVWLPSDIKQNNSKAKISIPPNIFFDTYSNYQDHSLYTPTTIRIDSNQFSFIQEDFVPLEYCSGAFNPVFKTPWSALPMPNHILLFIPNDAVARRRIEKEIEKEGFYTHLLKNDILNPLSFPYDTRTKEGFIGPSIFISFTWADIEIVKKIANSLFKKRRRYYLLYGDYQGVGDVPKNNSRNAVKEADFVLMVLSKNYIARIKEEPDGNLNAEVLEIIYKYREVNKKPLFLAVDNYQDLKGLPYDALGFSDIPFVGPELKNADMKTLDEAIEETLKVVDT